MQDEIEVADSTRASFRAREPSQEARESEAMDLVGIAEVLGSLQSQMKQLLDASKLTDEANKRFEKANKRSEEADRQLREGNKELKDMIKGLKLDIENMKAYIPYWGQSLASQSQSQSYASVARSGSNDSGSAGGSPKSVSFSGSDSSPRSNLADTEQARSNFTEVLRATEGLEELEFLDFEMFVRQNSKAVRMVVTKQRNWSSDVLQIREPQQFRGHDWLPLSGIMSR
ncbi:hypothetical protein LTR28_006069 [Elasticomyces elasticus]|nr:hypothetical protein LTR28_006069 [Elasticomyces elasticus]